MVQMPGCVSAAAARASRRRRSRCDGFRVSRGGSALSATVGRAGCPSPGTRDPCRRGRSRQRSCTARHAVPPAKRGSSPRRCGDAVRRPACQKRTGAVNDGAAASRLRLAHCGIVRRSRASHARGPAVRLRAPARTARGRAATVAGHRHGTGSAQLAKQPGACQRPPALQRRGRHASASAASSMLRPTK